MTDLRSSIPALAAAVRRDAGDRVSPVELVEQSLAAIDAGSDLNAFVSVDRARSRAAAEVAERELRDGHDRGPLHGLPVAVKDNIDVAGQHTRAGSLLFGDTPAAHDSTVVAKLRAAGAIIVGRTNMHELAWGGTTDNPHTGRSRNPWDPGRIPAGSSGGSGIAVAAGMVVAALGTDTGGSVRLPASVNGVSGLRPTIGRVSTAGVVPLAWTMDTVGPLAVRAADVGLVHDVIAGWDRRDRVTWPTFRGAPASSVDGSVWGGKSSVAGLRLGVLDGYALDGNQPDVSAAVLDAITTLEAAGATVSTISVPGIDQLVNAQIVVDAVEPSAMHADLLRERPDDYGDDVRAHLSIGLMFSGVEYVQAQRFRAWFREQLLAAMTDIDVLVTPTLPFTALHHGATTVEVDGVDLSLTAGNMKYTAIGSMTGFPALSVPAGFDRDGLPIGVLFTTRAGEEEIAVRIGDAFQELTDHHLQCPRA